MYRIFFEGSFTIAFQVPIKAPKANAFSESFIELLNDTKEEDRS